MGIEMRIKRKLTVLFIVLFGGLPVLAQGQAQNETNTWVEQAQASDVGSVDGIVKAVYDVISGPAGEQRDWDRFRGLFHPQGKLIPRGDDGTDFWTPEEYVERVDRFFLENGFFEEEVGRRTERYGNIAHVFSTYTSKRTLEDAEPFARGINSMQFVFEDGRWWVVSIFWQGETDEFPLPDVYLEP